MLHAFDDLELVGVASSGSIALARCQQALPDVILMDIVMPGMDGLETTRAILDQYPSVKIIMLTSFTKEDMVQEALQAGATSYLLKRNLVAERWIWLARWCLCRTFSTTGYVGN